MEIKTKNRVGLSIFFFLAGVIFSSWTSRIPTIKASLNLNEAELGSLLFLMPISSFLGLGLSGWLVEKYESRISLFWGFITLCIFFLMIGLSNSVVFFGLSIFLFAFANRILSISINTQSITVQRLFSKKIIGSFHGLWSIGGIVGVGITTLFIALDINIITHFYIVTSVGILTALFCFKILIKKDNTKSRTTISFRKLDPQLLLLGLLIVLIATCEGGMFDWSGIYFKDIVKVDVFSMGYFIFMIFMALSRFASDKLIEKLGMPKMYIISAVLVATGLTIAVAFPYFWPAIIGFSIVGLGTAAVFPMTLALAGKSKNYSPGIAISIVATFAMAGMLLGPPLIGYVAHAFGLRISFTMLIAFALMLIPISKKYFLITTIEE